MSTHAQPDGSREMFHLYVFRHEKNYSLMCALHPGTGLRIEDLDVQVKLRGSDYHEANGSNPCLFLDHDPGVEAIKIKVGELEYHFSYEELLVSLRPQVAK